MAQVANWGCCQTKSGHITVRGGSVRDACPPSTLSSRTRAANPRIPLPINNGRCGGQRIHLSSSSAPVRSLTLQGRPANGRACNVLQKVRLHARAQYNWLVTIPLASAGFWGEITSNVIFMAGFWGWAMAQVAKIFTCYAKKGIWDVTQVVSAGASHVSHHVPSQFPASRGSIIKMAKVALVQAVTTAIGMQHGFGSSLFAMALCFSLIVMYDAAGVRRQAGAQAEVLNTVVRELLSMHAVSQKKLKEVLGHTPLQVFMGAILGCICGTVYTYHVGGGAVLSA